MNLELSAYQRDDTWRVLLRVGLTSRESSELFLLGDRLISWPTEEMLSAGETPLPRGGMYLSEIAEKDSGIELGYATHESAERAAVVIGRQIETAFPAE